MFTHKAAQAARLLILPAMAAVVFSIAAGSPARAASAAPSTLAIQTNPVVGSNSVQATVTVPALCNNGICQPVFPPAPVNPPTPVLKSISLNPTSWVWNENGTLAVTVCLVNPAPSNYLIGVGATGGPENGGWMTAIAPATKNGITIPSGSACEVGDYAITAPMPTGVLPASATVYAILNQNCGTQVCNPNNRVNATLTMVVPPTGAFSISFNPANITMAAGQSPTTTVTVTLASKAQSNATVNISEYSPSPSVETGSVPSSVTVLAGHTSTDFQLPIKGCAPVTGAGDTCNLQLTASYGGATAPATLNVTCEGCQSES